MDDNKIETDESSIEADENKLEIKNTIIYDKHGLPKTFEIINNRLDYSKVELAGGCGIEIYDNVDKCYIRYLLIMHI